LNVLIPDALLSYTQSRRARASGATLEQLLDDLERQYTGIRFRMVDEQGRVRRHIRIFVNGEQVTDLAHGLRESDDLVIVQALSGG
jgi:molybdopterin synthase sulfur carrier subunit